MFDSIWEKIKMIEGVKVKILIVHPSPDGDFREVLRANDDLMGRVQQISVSNVLPGIIKAFHWHENQNDLFYVLAGNILLGLHDSRPKSATFGESQKMLLGELHQPKLVLIPKGVLHGYKVLGDKPATVLYIMDNEYNSDKPDEKRVKFDDPKIGFDWSDENG
jgi:dTDP-4-dehydrorhamnose 3,5-epimerase